MDYLVISKIAVMLCPLLLYFIYLVYNYDLDKKANELILDLCLITSFYLTSKFSIVGIGYVLLLIPIFISLLKKRLLAIMVIILLTFTLNNWYLLGSEVILFLLIRFIKNEKIFTILFFTIGFTGALLNSVDIFNLEEVLKMITEIAISIIFAIFILNLFDKFTCLINVYMDLNEIKKEVKVKESLFKITHEIKNPIAVCKGYLDMFKVDNPDHAKRYIPIIKSEIERTLILLQDFLCLRKLKLEKEELDLTLLFDETIAEMSIYESLAISYVKNYNDEIYVQGDYNRLRQVFLNIFKNSAEALKSPGIITVSIEEKDDIIIKITDNGPGMSHEVLEKIKEPFYTTKVNGTGLGVPLSIEIIEAHDWQIAYDSILNKGTTVTITIPRQEKK